MQQVDRWEHASKDNLYQKELFFIATLHQGMISSKSPASHSIEVATESCVSGGFTKSCQLANHDKLVISGLDLALTKQGDNIL